MLDHVSSPVFTERPPHDFCGAPETRLMLAVLQDALATFQRGLTTCSGAELEAFREVDRWFRNSDYDSPFSFESICSTLGIDPGCVRHGLNQLRIRAFQRRTDKTKRIVPRERIYTRRAWGNQLG